MIRTKIICTAGPSVESEKKIEELVKNGMSLMRLNCSHGDYDSRLVHIKRIRKIEKKLGRSIGIMIDLQGPKLRVGILPQAFTLHAGEKWRLSTDGQVSEKNKVIPTQIKGLANAVKVGGRIYMNDGLIRMEVVKKDKTNVWVKVLHGGLLESRKGVNIPHYKGSLSALTSKDKKDLNWGLEQDVDFIALSFVRSAKDMRSLRNIVSRKKLKTPPLLIAKIEKPEAVENLDEIIEASDGILVARGDLGIELNLSQVPVVQKQIIEKCRCHKKPVIVATQMLDSMRLHPIPTRAEVSDVASSIYAGVDAVLLTGETSTGKYPIQATRMMRHVISEVENHMIQKDFRKTPKDFDLKDYKESFLFHAMQLAEDIKAKAIVILTKRAALTKILSKLHPKQPIYSLALTTTAYRQMSLYWGVFPFDTAKKELSKRVEQGIQILKSAKVVKKSDQLVFIYWDYLSETNLNLKIYQVK